MECEKCKDDRDYCMNCPLVKDRSKEVIKVRLLPSDHNYAFDTPMEHIAGMVVNAYPDSYGCEIAIEELGFSREEVEKNNDTYNGFLFFTSTEYEVVE